jgi:hypothetical protein
MQTIPVDFVTTTEDIPAEKRAEETKELIRRCKVKGHTIQEKDVQLKKPQLISGTSLEGGWQQRLFAEIPD